MSTKPKKHSTTTNNHQEEARSRGSKNSKKTPRITEDTLLAALMRNEAAARQRFTDSGLIPGRAYILPVAHTPFQAGQKFVCASSATEHDLFYALSAYPRSVSADDSEWAAVAPFVREIPHTRASLACLKKEDAWWSEIEGENAVDVSAAKKVTQEQFKKALKTASKPPDDPKDLVSAVRTLVYMYEHNGKDVKDAILDAIFSSSKDGTWIDFIRPGLEIDLEAALCGDTGDLASSAEALHYFVDGAARRHGRSIMRLLDQSARCYAVGFADAY